MKVISCHFVIWREKTQITLSQGVNGFLEFKSPLKVLDYRQKIPIWLASGVHSGFLRIMSLKIL